MKTKLFFAGFLIIANTLGQSATNDLTGALQRGLFEEEANRNLDAAAQAYQIVSTQFDKDRALAATAIFRLGEIYRKQNKTNQAAAQYERIIREFSDQDTLATLSHQNLGSLRLSAQPTVVVTGSSADAELLAKLKKLSRAELREVMPSISNDQVLTDLIQQLNVAETKFSELARDVSDSHPDYLRSVEVQKLLKEKIDARVSGILKAMELRASSAAPASVQSNGSEVSAAATDEEEKEIRRIQEIIRNSPDLVNAPSGDPLMTPLCRAARNGHLRVARFLLDGSAAIDRRSGDRTPLHYAAGSGHRAMTEFLLQRGADPNARGDSGRTALHIAAENGFQAVAEALVSAKADVNPNTSRQETPVLLAAGNGHAELVRFLISRGAEIDTPRDTGETALMMAALRGHSETVIALLSAKANPDTLDKEGRSALSYAASGGHLESVKALLAAKADPNAGSISLPLHAAIHQKSPPVVEVLLRAGADPNRVANIRWQFTDGGQTYGFNGSYAALSPLFLAVKESNPDQVKLLLQFKADPNGVAPGGNPSPLIYLVLNQPELLQAFLDVGANPNPESNQWRWPPLASTDKAASVTLLLAKGASIESHFSGWTPLLAQAERGRAESVAALLKGGANVQARKPDGQTALHVAASGRNIEMVSALLAHKADINARDKDGLTPLDLVSGNKRQSRWLNGQSYQFNDVALTDKTAALLREHGGLSDLPKVDCIEVRRPDSSYTKTVFSKGTNNWNHFTLLEALFGNYFPGEPRLRSDFVRARPASLVDRFPLFTDFRPSANPPFPDLHRVIVVRPGAKPGQPARRIVVDLLLPTGTLDCGKDMPLEFGDVVEIVEREHTLQENSVGLTPEELLQIARCREGTVELLVRGKRTELKVSPWPSDASIGPVLARQEARSALFSSSDLSRVKVTRRDSADSKSREWVVDCSAGKAPDLWLRDGDVIEVPDKS